VLDARRKETIVFDETEGTMPQPGRTKQHATGVPTEVSYDTPLRGNRQLDHATSTVNNHPIPTVMLVHPFLKKYWSH
jgi:hypothetical protein